MAWGENSTGTHDLRSDSTSSCGTSREFLRDGMVRYGSQGRNKADNYKPNLLIKVKLTSEPSKVDGLVLLTVVLV